MGGLAGKFGIAFQVSEGWWGWRCTYRIPRLMRPITAALLLRSSWTFQRRGIGLAVVSSGCLLSSYGLWYGHQSGNPVCGNVHGGSGVVDVRQDVSRLTVTFSLFNNTCIPHGLGGNTVGEDEDQRDDIHQCEDRDRCILDVDIHLPPLGHSD